jgi:hypothetical protein
MVAVPEPDGIVWRTSSYSGPNGGCLEVAPASQGVLVRDSKDHHGPRLERLHALAAVQGPADRRRRFLVDEAWPQVPVELRGGLTKREREAILGYGLVGV